MHPNPIPRIVLLSLLFLSKAVAENGPGVASMNLKGIASPSCAQSEYLPSNACSGTVSAAFAPDHSLWQVWAQNEHVYLQSSRDQGRTWSPPIRVNPEAEAVRTQGESRPHIQIGPEGNLYVSWDLNLERRFSGHIRFSRSTDGGKSFSTPMTVNSNRDLIGHRFNEMIMAPDGRILIFWLDARDAEAAKRVGKEVNASSLYYTWSEDRGASFQPDRRAAASTCQCCRIRAAIDSDGLVSVIWRHVFSGSIRDHALLHFNAFDRPGALHRIADQGWAIEACPHHGPGFSIGDAGRYHATWFNNADSARGLFYSASDNRGESWSNPLNFGEPQGMASHPDVLALNKRTYLTWIEFDGSHNVLRMMRSKNRGKTWGTAENLAKSTEDTDHPFLISDGEKVFLSWHVPGVKYRIFQLE